MKLKKTPLTLIEVMIAMVLTGLLLTALFTYYFRSSKMRITIEQAKAVALQRQLIQHRLTSVCQSSFYTDSSNTLYFQFDNGIDVDPHYHGILQGKIYIKNHQLVFQMTNQIGSHRKQILASGINKISWKFFDEKEKKWKPSWPEDAEYAPRMVKMTTDDKIEYAIPISEEEPFISYGIDQ